MGGFVFGATTLFMKRYESGDIYAPYSTYRADPLGAKAVYDALRTLPGYSVRRNTEPLDRIRGNTPATWFINGMTFSDGSEYSVMHDELDGSLARSMQRVLEHGGRVVLAFAPVGGDLTRELNEQRDFNKRMDKRFGTKSDKDDKETEADDDKSRDKSENGKDAQQRRSAEKKREETIVEAEPGKDAGKKKDSGADKKDTDEKDESAEDRMSRFMKRFDDQVKWSSFWGVSLHFDSLDYDPATETYVPARAERSGDSTLPESLSLHSSLYFEPETADWTVLYKRGTYPVVMERPVGDGTLVMVADTYLLSNEAMRTERYPDLLAWLVGSHHEIVFDEAMLGTVSVPSLMVLMWRYGMQGVFAGLIVLAVLYIWKNGQPLVPHFEDDLPEDAGAYRGKDSASGFTNLLRRSVPREKLLRTCLAEWEKSYSHRAADFRDTVRDANAILFREENVPAKHRNVVRAYKEICELFAKHRLG